MKNLTYTDMASQKYPEKHPNPYKLISNPIQKRSNTTTSRVLRNKVQQNWKGFIEDAGPSKIRAIPKSVTNADTTKPSTGTPNETSNDKMWGTKDYNYVAIDCEMVGTDGNESILARVSLVDENGKCLYDTFVKPHAKVTDYRTAVSGVRPEDMERGLDFKTVQEKVYDLIHNKILVGHAIKHDLNVLYLSHPHKMIRDTSKYRPFREAANGRTPSLKFLSSKYLGLDIQRGEHSSLQDARATMALFMLVKKQWETDLRKFRYYKSDS